MIPTEQVDRDDPWFHLAVAGPVLPKEVLTDSLAWSGPAIIGGDTIREAASMPRIADKNLDGLAFLFRTEAEARARSNKGGSSFFIGKTIEGSEETERGRCYVPYLVSNRHVVWNAGASFASLNRRDGNPPDVIEIDQLDWHVHPRGDDVAITCMWDRFDIAIHKVTFIPDYWFLTEPFLQEAHVGVGDEVFMIGRFVNHQGAIHNKPAVRFGSISMMVEPLWNSAVSKDQDSFAVEMRSRTGFSGAPVCMYRTVATTLTDVPQAHKDFHKLLGVNWGYVLDENRENTWLNGVAPAWKITETLEGVPALKKKHEDLSEEFHRRFKKRGATQTAAVSDDDLESDASHRERFNRLLSAATKSPKSSG